MRTRRSKFLRRRNHRGSILVMVVAALAVVGLIMTTLAYTARVENQAAANWAEGLQARISAITGMPHFSSLDDEAASGDDGTRNTFGYDANIRELGDRSRVAKLVRFQLRLDDDGVASDQERARKLTLDLHDRRGDATDGHDDFKPLIAESSLAYSLVEDTSAKININTLLGVDTISDSENSVVDDGYVGDPITGFSAERFAEFVDRLFEIRGVESEITGSELARVIMEHRYGPDRRAGVAGLDDDFNGPDPQDSRSFETDGEIRRTRGHSAHRYLDSLAYDGLDNDRDGEIDEPGESIETDGLDNDFDGEVDEAGEATDDPSDYQADLRLEPNGDDAHYHRLDELKSVAGMTPEAFEAIAPFLTVFSISRPATPRTRGASHGFMKLDPNTANPEEMFQALRVRYPDSPEALLGQYVANIVDRRDLDDIPSELVLGSRGVTYYGRERTPYINEVFPDSPSYDEDGDDGQYVELVNPYSETISLAGWTLETGTSVYRFVENIPAHSYLIITDDFDESNDPEPTRISGMGSMYDIFGYVPLGLDEQYSVDPTFDLPDERGTVYLFDANRNLVDSFAYSGGTYAGVLNSFQRGDPHLREYQWAAATPFKPNADTGQLNDLEDEISIFIEELHNRPFRSPLEMLLVSTSFARGEAMPNDPNDENDDENHDGGDDLPSSVEDEALDLAGRPETNDFRRLPSIVSSNPNNLDAEIMDAFLPGVPMRHRGLNATIAIERALNEGRTAEEALARQRLNANRRAPVLHGRINLNTASPAVLAFLPGIDESLAARMSAARRGDRFDELDVSVSEIVASNEWLRDLSPIDPPRWESLAELLRDNALWGEDDLVERIVRIFPFSRLIVFHSLSYKVTTANIPNPVSVNSSKRRSSVYRVERIVAGDANSISNVKFRFLPRRPVAPTAVEGVEDDDQ